MIFRLAFACFFLATLPARSFDSAVVFNELQFHPTNEAAETEWVELRNLHGVDIDLSRWSLTGEIEFTFPEGVILPGGAHLVVAKTPGQIPGARGPFAGQLSNSGGAVRLVNQNGRIMDELRYEDGGDWPVGPDGSGATLARREASAKSGPAAWAASTQAGGTPGAVNFPAGIVPPSLVLNEIAGAGQAGFFVELRNVSASALDSTGWTLRASTGETFSLPAGSIAAGEFLTLDPLALGFAPTDGTRLFLFAPANAGLRDAREVTARRGGLAADARWGHPTTATPGATNLFAISDAIVINEIFYHGRGASPEQWIELHNRSGETVNLAGWKVSEGVEFAFAAGTTIPAGGFLVLAWDPAAFGALHPGIAALGPWSGALAGKGELLRLLDMNDNVVDEVRYFDGGRWPEDADGGGSSLELRDPRADNSRGETWGASDESAASTWQTVSYAGPATNPNSGDPTTYNEFVFGLLGSGEFLIDDLSVKDVTQGNAELIQNGGFSSGTAASWRIIGTHAGTIVDDPTAPGNKVLKVSSSGSTEHMHNHAETTLKNGASYHAITASDTYAISFRAKWLHGSNRLHSRLWHNRLARQTLLNAPATGGTPGAPNRSRVGNVGPTFESLAHAPVVPPVNQPATVSIQVADPDGVGSVELFTSVNGAAFSSTPMATNGDGIYTATIAGKPASTLVRFYVRATDGLGAAAFFPADGPSARAMIPWADGRALLAFANGAKPHNIRVVLPTADATELYKPENLMSDAAVPCTVILDESVAFYRARVRLKSSEHGRITDTRCGYTLEFPPDDLFFGQHDTIAIDRSGGTSSGQKEILLKRLTNAAGGIYTPEDDICRVISAIGTFPGQFTGAGITGAAILSKTRLDKEFLDAQFENGGDGSQHKYERVYVLTETINPTTRAVTAISGANVLTPVSEQPKVPQSTTGPPGVNVQSLGSNKENYRWYWLLQNNREADDFTGIINVTGALSQAPGSANFNSLVSQRIDVDAWLRACIPAALFGVQDNYLGTGGGQHNALIYFPPGQKAVLMPWDLDFLQTNTTASLTAGGDVNKFIANPVWKRLYYGHLLDILNRSFNSANMQKWAVHYSRFGTEDMTAHVSSYLVPRAAYAMSVINGTNGQTAPIANVPFRITTASPLTVSTPFATVAGDGWVDVAEIRLAGAAQGLAATWTDDNSWTLQLPVQAGAKTYTLTAHNRQGAQVGSASITITGAGGVFPAAPGSLAVSELHYNPPGSSDGTEFVELLNLTGATLDLSGCHFDEELGQGIAYTFPNGVQLAPGARILVVRDVTAFNAQYGAGLPLAPGVFTGALDNNGESLVLYSASGEVLFRISYGDDLLAADGEGKSLVRVLSSTAPDAAGSGWRASLQDGGNPNASDALPFAGAPLADGDGDGLGALLEYVLGTSDSQPAQAAPLIFSRDPFGACFVTFSRVTNADDAVLGIESAASLESPWAPAAASRVATNLIGTIATETWQLTPPASGTSFFIRLKATLR